MFFLIKVLSLVLLFELPGLQCYNYSDPDDWGKEYPTCDGKSQSPINIPWSEGISDLKVISNLDFHNCDVPPDSISIKNNGHLVEVTPKWSNNANASSMTGGPFGNETYILGLINFHWGENNTVGSEHTIDGKRANLEVHLGYYNAKYGSIPEAFKHSDGVAVVAGLYDASMESSSRAIDHIWTGLTRIRKPGAETRITPFPMSEFEPLDGGLEYVTYSGSFTYPPCLEIVTWFVTLKTFSVTSQQLKYLRNTIHLRYGDKHNYRPLQPLNGRQLHTVHAN